MRKITHKLLLAIESSCDDSCFAIMNSKHELFYQRKISQRRLHQPFGGIVPQLAAIGHRKSFEQFLTIASKRNSLMSNIKFIAVTAGPGIGSCLNVGFEFAKNLSISHKVPLLPINHLLGHILSVDFKKECEFPRLSLITSGGNTQMVFSYSVFRHHILGLTIDDAIGEAIDKTARMINCSWAESGGLGFELEKLAKLGVSADVEVNSLEAHADPLCFSFSGLKTSLKTFIIKNYSSMTKFDLAATIQSVLFGHVAARLKNCIEMLSNAKIEFKQVSLIGGVASNCFLISLVEKLCRDRGKVLYVPDSQFCTDNAVMIGVAGYKMWKSKEFAKFGKKMSRVDSEWNLEELSINKTTID